MSERRRKYDAVIFDLDGTLLDTLSDMSDSVNHVLNEYGYAPHTEEEIRSYVGDGIRKLIERAMPDGSSEEMCAEATEKYREYYKDHCMIRTAPYDGIYEMLDSLIAGGCRLAVVTNKNSDASGRMVDNYFEGYFEVCLGQSDDIPKKPDKAMVFMALEEMEISAERAVYAGDSDVDIATAENAGIPCISCSWGFRSEEFLREHGAEIIAESPEDAADAVLQVL